MSPLVVTTFSRCTTSLVISILAKVSLNQNFVDQPLVRCSVERLTNHSLRRTNRQIRKFGPKLLNRLFAFQHNFLASTRDDLFRVGSRLRFQIFSQPRHGFLRLGSARACLGSCFVDHAASFFFARCGLCRCRLGSL
jgi:hypothetical protein